MSNKQKESDKLMKLMTRKSLKARPPSIQTQGKVVKKEERYKTKSMILVLDSLKKNDSLQQLVYISPESLIKESKLQSSLLERYRETKSFKPLWTFQESAIQFAQWREMDQDQVGTRGYMLCDEMGLGKTKTMLSIILKQNQLASRRSEKRFNGPTLVVCKEQLIDNWLRELDSFPEKSFYYEIITNDRDTLGERDERERRYHLEECCDLVFTTYTTITGNRQRLLFDIVWIRIAADEAHIMVNEETDVSQRMFMLKSEIKVVITGSPKQNHDSDILNLCRFIGVPQGEQIVLDKIMLRRLNKDFEGMKGLLLPEKREPVSRLIEYVPFATKAEHLLYLVYAKLALKRGTGINITYLISLMRELCICPAVIKNLILPDCLLGFSHKEFTIVSSSSKGKDPKEDKREKLRSILNNQFPSESFSITITTGESYQKGGSREEFSWTLLRKNCREEKQLWKELSQQKDWSQPPSFLRENDSPQNRLIMKALLDRVIRFDRPLSKERVVLEYLRNTPLEDKVVIFSNMIESLHRLQKFMFELYGYDSIVNTGETKSLNSAKIERFRREPSLKVLLMTLKYGNEGLNIQEANHIFFLDPWYNPSTMEQGEFRIQRPGQKKKVFIVYFIMKNTIENAVMNLAEKKKSIQDSLPLMKKKKKKEESPLFDYTITLREANIK